MIDRRSATLAIVGAAASAGCTTASPPRRPNEVAHVPWSRQASLYEVNVRQFTPEGTLAAFESHLPRLARMGVGILWFMPIQPIGVQQRKGTLGSYYSIRDHTAVNPEFGTLDDFRRVVAKAHALGLKVILDWVANHTAWDHPWVTQHPERYKRNERGEVYSVTFGSGPTVEYWTDVVGLDYTEPGLWPAMTDAMAWWLREAGIDGFRCDVAGLVPTPFWEQARAALERIKPVFMLAESDKSELHARAFDMTYDWDLYDQLRAIAQGRADARALQAWWHRREARYPADAYRMTFTGNHDSNSWHGSDRELYGSVEAFQAMAVLAATLPGTPLVYGGQEAFFEKRLQFFEEDPIDWKDRPLEGFYRELLTLKQRHPALANGVQGGRLEFDDVGNDGVLALRRVHRLQSLAVQVNLTGRAQAFATVSGPRPSLGPWAWTIAELPR